LTLVQQFPNLYADGKTPALIDFIGEVLAHHGLGGNPDVVAELDMVIKQYIAEGGT
jgi:hypothetical protein